MWSVGHYMDPTLGPGFNESWGTGQPSPQVGSSSGCAFRQPNGDHKACHILNPVALLPTETGPPEHDCTRT